MSKASMKESYTKAGAEMQRQQDNGPQALVRRHKDFLEARLAHIAKWVTANVRPEALIRFALLDLQQNDKLRACDPTTIYTGLLACAVTGLEPGALKGEAYLVPFGGKAQFMAGWKGLVKQAKRSREVIGIVAHVVREADEYDVQLGTTNKIHHRMAKGERGHIVGSYAVATFVGGHQEIEPLDMGDLERIRAVAEKRGKSPAWTDWPDEMSRKSAIRRLAKRLPLGADYHIGMAIEQAHEDGKNDRDVLDIVTDGEASRTEEGAERAASMRAQAEGDRPPTPEEEAAMDGA